MRGLSLIATAFALAACVATDQPAGLDTPQLTAEKAVVTANASSASVEPGLGYIVQNGEVTWQWLEKCFVPCGITPLGNERFRVDMRFSDEVLPVIVSTTPPTYDRDNCCGGAGDDSGSDGGYDTTAVFTDPVVRGATGLGYIPGENSDAVLARVIQREFCRGRCKSIKPIAKGIFRLEVAGKDGTIRKRVMRAGP